MTLSDSAERFWRCSTAVRRSAPLVHNITNLVVQNETASAIAAVGATQMTLHTVEEARTAATIAHAMAVNPGTLDATWLECAHSAVDTARERGTPWVLDPVAAGMSAFRRTEALRLLEMGPTVLKANPSEILALPSAEPSGRAADSVHSTEQALGAAIDLARRHDCIVVVTGAEDLVTDGRDLIRMGNGRHMMGRMIGSGCMLTSVIACFLAVGGDPMEATQAAVAHFTVAGEVAADRAGGPGSLKPLLIDVLYNLEENELRERLRVIEEAAPSAR